MKKSKGNQQHNKAHYDFLYDKVDIGYHLKFLQNRDFKFRDYTNSHISWYGFYKGDFQKKIKEKVVLELGAGDGLNSAIMASFGAKVISNDISKKTGELIQKLNNSYSFKYPIKFIGEDFLKAQIEHNSIDFVVGKALLHHLDHQLEKNFIEKITEILKVDGQARFFEPAVNSKLLDELRWATPVPGRPSKWLQPKAFKKWEEADPHPLRENSSKHYRQLGELFFKKVMVTPMGVFDRFYRILPLRGINKKKFRQRILKLEPRLPFWIKYKGARSQLIIFENPKTYEQT